jgi:hypothetical protein
MAAVLVAALPTRLLAPVVTVLAAFGLLVFFYVALAGLTLAATGTAPIEFATSATTSEQGRAALVIPLAIGLAGFETRQRPVTGSDR